MTGEYVYLNHNSYTKDGERRCYAAFADVSGNVVNFNAAAILDSAFPAAFSVCNLSFSMQQYGRSTAFILEAVDTIGQMIVKK